MTNSCTLVDSHCHIPVIEGIPEAEVLANAKANDISHMLCVCIDLDSFQPVLQTARQHDHIFASVGVHPNSEVNKEPAVDELVQLASSHPRIVAIGETGLDYFRSDGDLEWQRQRFRTHIQAAKESGKPLIIHCREAKDDTIRLLQEEGAETVGGVMHCFVEDHATALAAIELGFYISFSGIVTFKNAQDLQAVARQIPLEKMLVETDSPYLAPVPFRGKTNQPAYVKHVAECIAELRNIPFEQVAEVTTDNFFRLFNISRSINQAI